MIVSSLCNAGTKFSGEEGMEENRRGWCSVGMADQNTLRSSDSHSHSHSKRQKPDLSISPTTTTTKERKENVSAKIVALQQLVSPYGKTDAASVLLEAMEYIQFLHDQVKVLSAPYMEQSRAEESLRSRGLCVVPVECTAGVARSNGADIWAPIKSPSPN